jgi:putative nucleotidyltransferase with HDIG domain
MGGANTRWESRSAWATSLRLTVLVGPVVASVATAWGCRLLLPAPTGAATRLAVLGVLLVVSSLTLVLVDRLGRRLLPVVTLLDLSMLFPDRAPSRLAVAREAVRRRPIEEQLARVRDAGADPGAVAREILTLVAAMRAHDRPTRGHAERVRMFTDLLAEQLHVPRRDRDLLRWAAILHDIGKLKVPSTLLNKPGKPTAAEWVLLKAHPQHGAEIAAGLLPWLGEWAEVVVSHHERYDGTGYPIGLRGVGIPYGARIVAVADAYDVMTAARAYKRPVSRAAALAELVRFSGTQFDPAVVRAMVTVGAPRLRRAQGLLAWLADVPMVAGSVPAATLARVVSAGALATGAVTGTAPVLPAPTTPPPATSAAGQQHGSVPHAAGRHRATDPASPTATDVRSGVAGTVVSAGDPTTQGAADDVPQTSSTAGPATASASTPQAPAPPAGATPEPSTRPTGSTSGTGTGGSHGAGGTGGPGGTSGQLTDTVTSATDGVGSVVGTVTGTVGGVVADPTGTLDQTLTDPVGTVTGTVGTVTGSVGGAVGGVLGSLTGSGSSGSGSSGSGSSGPGSGGTSPNSGPGSTSSGSGSSGSDGSGSGHSGGGLLGGLLGH